MLEPQISVRDDVLAWLLEADQEQPGVRYVTLRDVLGAPPADPRLREAQEAVMASGPVPAILAAQAPEGYWVKPGRGYGPKYQGTVWQVIFLAQLGADGADARVRLACEYVLSHAVDRNGGFSANGTPGGFIHCLGGGLGGALIDLGWLGDPRLQAALEWQARTITGEGIAGPESRDSSARYYKSGTSGPLFACAANAGLPCAWGGVKAALALTKVPPALRTPAMEAALEQGIAFLLSRDPSVADYPFGYGKRPSSSWFKLGYPIGYVTDFLQNLEVLCAAGYSHDPRLAQSLRLLETKRDASGRWRLEYTYNGKTWTDVEQKGQPSKWVTLRAVKVLKAANGVHA